MSDGFYLDGSGMEPPLGNPERYYRVRPIADSGEDDSEILAVVDPPIALNGRPIEVLRLRARGDSALLRPDGGIALEHHLQDSVTVYVSTPGYEADFGIRISAVASDLPELWRRGGYWQWFKDSIEAFVAREGHANIPSEHVEAGFELGKYVVKLRRQHEHGVRFRDQEVFLESLPGWVW